MSRLISFLGTGNYSKTKYKLNDKQHQTAFVADALTRLLNVDEVVILATPSAWETNGKALLETLPDGIECSFKKIPDGQSEKELWRQFEVLRDAIITDDPDKVILDITHGFRAQPFFAAGVLAQLSASGKLPKSTRVLYGEYRPEGVSPIWDLSLFIELLGWVQGTAILRHTGDGRALIATLQHESRQQATTIAHAGGRDFPDTSKLIKAIKNFTEDLSTIRTASLITGYCQEKEKQGLSSAAELNSAINEYRSQVEQWLPALVPLLDSLLELSDGLPADKLHGAEGFAAMQTLARRYLELGRYPEAAVIFREGWISQYADEAGVEVDSGRFSQQARKMAEERWRKNMGNEARAIAKVRNDLQHGGFNEQPLIACKLREQVEKKVDEFTALHYAANIATTSGQTWFVSRHPGAIDWAKNQNIQVNRQVAHLDISAVNAGDTVIGTLPVHLVAQLTEKGVHYLHLVVDIPPQFRGQELSADQLRQFNAQLQTYAANRLDTNPEHHRHAQ